MNNQEERDNLIDLGAASVETKGPSFGSDDTNVGKIPFAGLSEE